MDVGDDVPLGREDQSHSGSTCCRVLLIHCSFYSHRPAGFCDNVGSKLWKKEEGREKSVVIKHLCQGLAREREKVMVDMWEPASKQSILKDNI